MKKQKIKLLIFSLLLTLSSLQASSLLFESSLPFKEGIITYQITGNKIGYAKAYIRNYGKEIALLSNYTQRIMSAKQIHHTLTLIRNDERSQIDLDTGEIRNLESLRKQLDRYFALLTPDAQERLLQAPIVDQYPLKCQPIEIDETQYCLNGNIIVSKKRHFFGFNENWKIVNMEERSVNSKYFELSDFNEATIESLSQNSSVY